MSLFIIALIISLTIATIGFLALGDIFQMVISFPKNFTYQAFKYRFPLMAIGIISFGMAIYLWIPTLGTISWPWLAVYGFLFTKLFISGFIAPTYILFPSQHQSAKYKSVKEVEPMLTDESIVQVIVVKNEAYAFPERWIDRPHIAGFQMGEEDLIMTFCALANLGVTFKNDYNGQPMDLKLITQLENNLVLFDANTQKPIEQIYGKIVETQERLNQVPTVAMPFSAFKELYPGGKVFFNPPTRNILDRVVRFLLAKILYVPGAHLDPTNPDPAFPTISYDDQRIASKERIYGVSLAGRNIAFTLDYIKEQGNSVVEKIGDQNITIKYFEEYDFVDVFYGDVPEVDANGYDENGNLVERVIHASRALWIVWANFYPEAEVRVSNKANVKPHSASLAA